MLKRIAICLLVLAVGCGSPQEMASPSSLPVFQAEQLTIVPLADRDLPYARVHPVDLTDDFPTDSDGVSMFERTGTLYYHPVVMAQRGLELLASYDINGDPEYLRMSRLHADRLIEEGVSFGGGLYFPYTFDFALHGRDDAVLVAPWYSAMAQGQALSLFVRLYSATQDQRYLQAADSTFETFNRFRNDGADPWTVMVDDAGYLWLEEYPTVEADHHAFNGHMFAAFGLYDYYEATGLGENLFQGALTTVLHYFDSYRNPGGFSYYELKYGVTDEKYHAIHIRQLQLLGRMTTDSRFDTMAETLMCDFTPDPEDLAGVIC